MSTVTDRLQTWAQLYLRFQARQTGDRMDFVEWASLVQMRDNLELHLDLLAGGRVA